jgi:hypothetical protein
MLCENLKLNCFFQERFERVPQNHRLETAYCLPLNSSLFWHSQDVPQTHLCAGFDTSRSCPPKKRFIKPTIFEMTAVWQHLRELTCFRQIERGVL